MRIPRPIQRCIEAFERLPGIGPKTAARLTYYLLHVPVEKIEEFASALVGLKRDIQLCSACFNVGEQNPCAICADPHRDQTTICVVEQPLDVLAIEKTNQYQGLYHVLHGVIAPLAHIGPEDIYLPQLVDRIKNPSFDYAQDRVSRIQEIILALNPTMEGEATSLYIKNEIETLRLRSGQDIKNTNQKLNSNEFKLSRLAQGLPLGGDLEYADPVTLGQALQHRRNL